MCWAMIWITIRRVSWVTTGLSRTLYHPQDAPPPRHAPPIPGLYRIFDLTPTSSSSSGFSTPLLSPTTSGTTFPRRVRYRFVSSRRSRVCFSGFYKRAAGVSLHSPGLRYPPEECLYTPLQEFTGGYLYTPPPAHVPRG